jgi:O-acetyl-ADP-ribose deacetylase (regulator of RNase III)
MTEILVVKNDILNLNVDVIVNAANNTLLGGGGIDGLIHKMAGRELRNYCENLGGCETGQAKLTPGFNLKVKNIIHTVGPIWNEEYENENSKLLASCYNNSLRICNENFFTSIAFPCISTGVYQYPPEKAAKITYESVHLFLKNNPTLLEKIIFCCFLESDYQIYKKLFNI